MHIGKQSTEFEFKNSTYIGPYKFTTKDSALDVESYFKNFEAFFGDNMQEMIANYCKKYGTKHNPEQKEIQNQR